MVCRITLDQAESAELPNLTQIQNNDDKFFVGIYTLLTPRQRCIFFVPLIK